MMRTIKDLKSKTSSMESDGVYIMPFNPKYEKDELEERMLKVVEEQPSVALRFLCLIGDYKVGTSKQYISQIIDSNDIPNLGESMLIASPTGSGKTSAVIKMLNAGHLCDQQKDGALSVQKGRYQGIERTRCSCRVA